MIRYTNKNIRIFPEEYKKEEKMKRDLKYISKEDKNNRIKEYSNDNKYNRIKYITKRYTKAKIKNNIYNYYSITPDSLKGLTEGSIYGIMCYKGFYLEDCNLHSYFGKEWIRRDIFKWVSKMIN